jgi:hypothetical protein
MFARVRGSAVYEPFDAYDRSEWNSGPQSEAFLPMSVVFAGNRPVPVHDDAERLQQVRGRGYHCPRPLHGLLRPRQEEDQAHARCHHRARYFCEDMLGVVFSNKSTEFFSMVSICF